MRGAPVRDERAASEEAPDGGCGSAVYLQMLEGFSMNPVDVKAVCERYLRGSTVPAEARSGGVGAYVYLYGKGHELFELYSSTGDRSHLPGARECFEAAVANFNETGTAVLAALYCMVLMELGGVYSSLGEHQRAVSVLQQCAHLSKEEKYLPGVFGALNNLGMVYEQQGDYEQARSSYRESLEQQRRHKKEASEDNVAKTEWNLGRVELRLGNCEQALRLLEPANKVFKKVGLTRFYDQSSRDIAEARSRLGRGEAPSSPAAGKRLPFMKRLLARR
jgi:tetratricopeptide (TPR) repeat protein